MNKEIEKVSRKIKVLIKGEESYTFEVELNKQFTLDEALSDHSFKTLQGDIKLALVKEYKRKSKIEGV